MSQNLITSGVVDPAQLPLDQVRQEIAALLKISLSQIERLECWPHQIWVKLVESRAKFISYRRLPLWIKEGLEAIARCTSRANLDELGEICGGSNSLKPLPKTPQVFYSAIAESWVGL